MNLENIRELRSPLQFVCAPDDPDCRLGITIREVSRDKKTERVHLFDTTTGVYSGYRDRVSDPETKLMLSHNGRDYLYKGRHKNGEQYYWKKELGRIYQTGEKEVISENAMPYLHEVDGVVSLGRPDMLPRLCRELTPRERIEAQAESEDRTPAEIYADRLGGLEDVLSDNPQPKIESAPESGDDLPDTNLDENDRSSLELGQEPSHPER